MEAQGRKGHPRPCCRPLRPRAEDLLFDPLALPLSTGMEESRRDGIETIEGIKAIKAELPGVSTILGLSNVSFGLNPAARHVLNSMFLHECVEAGLDAAIVHAGRIIPLSRIDEHAREVCLDLIYDRRRTGYDPLSELLAIFEGATSASQEREDRSGWPVERRLELRIVDGDRNGLEDDLAEALGRRLRRSSDRERHTPGRDEDRRGSLRVRRDAASVRAAVRRDDEVRRVVPRAAHGEVRSGRQGNGRSRDSAR